MTRELKKLSVSGKILDGSFKLDDNKVFRIQSKADFIEAQMS